MATSMWFTDVREAKKAAIIQDGRAKLHYDFVDGREMVEIYDTSTGLIIERKWKKPTMIGGEGAWNHEIGQGIENDSIDIRESKDNPIFLRIDTKSDFQWRIRNLPFPLETYQLSVEDYDSTIVLRTANKKYYKRFTVPDLDRIGVKLDLSSLSMTHSNNTLVISYKKPQVYLDYEKEVRKELAKSKLISGDGAPCTSM